MLMRWLAWRSASVVLGATALAGLVGCQGLEGARVRDNSSPAVAVRATFRPDALMRGDGSRGGIEVGYDRYRGKDTQTLNAGQNVDLNDLRVDGPDSLNNEVTVQLLHMAYTHRARWGSNFEFEPMLGGGRQGLRFKIDPTNSALRPEISRYMPVFVYGLTPRWRFNDTLALEGRVSGTVGGSNGNLVRTYSFDAGLLVSPAPNVALRIGYSDRRLSAELTDSLSEVDVHVRGPAAALVFEF